MNRANNFENFILKYAKLISTSDDSSNSSQQKYQKEGGEPWTKSYPKKIIKKNKISFKSEYENSDIEQN